MQSEHFDKKIKDAAELHHPAYDEKAWGKMEKMLDKHLPQEKDDRRRILFFILLFLLIGGGVTSALLLTRGKKEPVAVSSEPRTKSREPGAASHEPSAMNREPGAMSQQPVAKPGAAGHEPIAKSRELSVFNKTSGDKSVTNKIQNTKQDKLKVNDKKQDITDVSKTQTATTKNNKPLTSPEREPRNQQRATSNEQPATSPDRETRNQQPVTSPERQPRDQQPATRNEKPETVTAGSAANTVIATVKEDKKEDKKEEKKDEAIAKTKADKPIKIKNRRTSYFSLNFSAGPDVSMVAKGGAGKMNLMAGLGLGYTYKNRLTLRAGFYAANKVYSADPGDYHPPYRFYYYYPNLQKIDANCRVYEIPVSLSYQFGNNKKQNWFVSSGISSYLMKRETYNYYYKQDPSQPTISKQRTMNGVNKHYFSVLTVSGGYQKNIRRSVSLTVEPYLKMPLKGVGYGKVMLNSSGVLFTVGVKPFSIFSKGK